MFLTLTMTIFSCGGKNNLFDSVETENGVFTLTVSDGTSRKLFRLWDDASAKNNLISALSKVAAKPFSGTPHDVPAPAVDSPAYVFSAFTKDGSDFSVLYSGGYLVTDDGSVYEFDFDFASVPEKYSFTEDSTINSAATGFESILARDGGTFRAIAFLIPNTERPAGDCFRYAISVDSLERVLGMDFYSALPDSVEMRVEASFDRSFWR